MGNNNKQVESVCKAGQGVRNFRKRKKKKTTQKKQKSQITRDVSCYSTLLRSKLDRFKVSF